MRLFVAEKPSLARAIADALPGPQQRSKTHITCGEGNVVAWCAGHILQTAPPEAYSDAYARWRLEDLPITPDAWKLEVTTPELLKAIQALLRRADRVVHAGDPDREGQLLVDEVLEFLAYRGPVDRLLVSDLRPEAVRRQLDRLEPNAKYRPLYASALARQRADWLFGMNMTRLYTLLGRRGGYDGVLSVGRVQTPLLGLIVSRDRAIAQFEPAPYFSVDADIQTEGGLSFRARWAPGPAHNAHLDPEGRLPRRDVADDVSARARGQRGVVHVRSLQLKSEPPPLPYALADLQMDAGKRLGLSAQEVMGACQSLYETHRLTTYPRSDCAHLPQGHWHQAPEVFAAIVRRAPGLAAAAAQCDVTLQSKAWNDKKVTAHHAIIPTPSASAPPAQLSDRERAIYELIARRYLAQFCLPHEYQQTQVTLLIAGETFKATGRQVLTPGWKALSDDVRDDDAAAEGGGAEDGADSRTPLPELSVGESIVAKDVTVRDRHTQPPKPFTDASLMAAMCGVAKYVTDPRVKKLLTETDGIGTPATRAAIIETLFERGYAARAKKTIVSTETGRALIAALPPVATTPDMTAVWEAAMRAIHDREQSLEAFVACISTELRALVAQGKTLGSIAVPKAARAHAPTSRAPRGARSKPNVRRHAT